MKEGKAYNHGYLSAGSEMSAGPEMSAGKGRVCVKKGYFFSDMPLRHACPADFLSQTVVRFISDRCPCAIRSFAQFTSYFLITA